MLLPGGGGTPIVMGTGDVPLDRVYILMFQHWHRVVYSPSLFATGLVYDLAVYDRVQF